MAERLQKVLARAGVASRRKAEELIRAGRVTVNGAVAEVGTQVDPGRDAVKVDGRRVRSAAPSRYFLVNKPRGYITTKSDPEGRPTVFELLPQQRQLGAVVAVGRLDFNSEGLLILTDDGELAQRIAHPRYGCSKTYEVKVKGVPEREAIDRLRAGVVIEGRRTAPARIRLLRGPRRGRERNSWWSITLSEGRTRQIREMFHRIGHPVQRLRRVAIGSVSDPALGPGGVRNLTRGEVERLRGAPAKRGRRREG